MLWKHTCYTYRVSGLSRGAPWSVQGQASGAMGSLIWWVATLPTAGGWNWMCFKTPFNLNRSVNLNPAGRCYATQAICFTGSSYWLISTLSIQPMTFACDHWNGCSVSAKRAVRTDLPANNKRRVKRSSLVSVFGADCRWSLCISENWKVYSK